MKTPRRKHSARRAPARAPAGETFSQLAEIRARLTEAEAALRAIRTGEVDAVVVTGKQGDQVFTLEGAGHAYRLLIESMNEGALTLTADKTILFANQCFATMVKCPLEEVMGSSFRRFISDEARATLRPLMKRATKTGSKIQVLLHAGDGSLVPALLSIRELANEGSDKVIIGMVVTNMTEVRRTEELLRSLTNRVVQVQEAERGSVAVELHDTITQMMCAVLVRSQTLADRLPASEQTAKKEAVKLRELLSEAAEEVERISRNLRPSVLDHLGLVAGLQEASTEFSHRTGVSVKLVCARLAVRLPVDTELALYRILQETLKNVEQHARASHVMVHLTKPDGFVQLSIQDNGTGFDPKHRPARRKGKETNGFGLLGMRERAAYVGGDLKVKSNGRTGTEIEIRIPVPVAMAGN